MVFTAHPFADHHAARITPAVQADAGPVDHHTLLAEIERLRDEVRRSAEAAARSETLSRAVLDSSTDYAILTLDPQGRVSSWNAGAERVLGWAEADILGQPGDVIFTPEDVAHGVPQTEMACTRESGRSVDERYHVRRDGRRFWAAGMMTPLRTAAAEEIGFLKILRDRTSEHEAQEALRTSEAKLRLERAMLEAIFRHAPVGLSLAEAPGGRSLLLNDELREMIGRGVSGEDLGRWADAGVRRLDGRPYAIEEYPIVRSAENGEVVRRERASIHRPDGAARRVEISSTPVQGPDGAVAAAICVLVDVEEREQALERQQLLMGELAHRMKNTLAMVQAIVSQTLRAAPTTQEARELIMQRFAVLASAQDILTQTSWDSAPLSAVVRNALAPIGPERIGIEGPEVRLGSRAALNFTLALHELATNAVKYGALSNVEGRVEVAWRVESAGAGDTRPFRGPAGGGPPVPPPACRGFGSRLLDGLSRTFEARSRYVYASTGVCWCVEVGLAALQQV